MELHLNCAPQELIDKLKPALEAMPLPAYDATPDPALAELKELNLRDHLARFEDLVFNGKGACLCPVHAETDPSFEVKRHTDGHWYWFDWHNQGRAGFSGTILDYYVTVKGMSLGEAIALVKEREGAAEPPAKLPKVRSAPPTPAATTSRDRIVTMDAKPLGNFKSRETHYLMQDRIPLGMFVLLSGVGGSGKSTFLSEIAARVSRGDPLPGSTKALVPAGTTYYITTENQPEEVFRPRIIAANGDLAKIIYARNVLIEAPGGSKGLRIFDVQAHLPALEKSLDEYDDIRILAIDPAISHTNEKMDDSRAKPVRQLIDVLSDLAERRKILVAGVSHHNKGLATSARGKVAGSHQWVDAARVALGIAEDKTDLTGEARFLSVLKSNVFVTRQTLAFRIVNVIVTDPDAPDLFLRAGRVVFGDEVDIDIESVFNPDKVQESMTMKAIRLLNNELKAGPRDSDEIWDMAQAQGITESAFKAARAKCRIHPQKVGGRFGEESEQKWTLWLPDHWETYKGSKR